MLVLEPIFEADLPPEQYAYRPGRSAQQAVESERAFVGIAPARKPQIIPRIKFYIFPPRSDMHAQPAMQTKKGTSIGTHDDRMILRSGTQACPDLDRRPQSASMEPDKTVAPVRGAPAEILIAGAALLMLVGAQWLLSRTIIATNYYGADGKMAQSAVLAALEFARYFDVTNLSPIQGVGTQLLPKNVWANPAYWPFAWFDPDTATDVSALIALACFASGVYVMLRCFDVPVVPSALAAQPCLALFAPAIFIVYMPTNFCLTPGDAVVYAPYMIALGLLGRLQPGSWRPFVATAGGISALLLYSIYCDPLWTMIAAFSWAVPFAIVTLSPLRVKAIMLRGAALACYLALLLLSGVAGYLITLSQYTARVQFAETIDRVRGPGYVSAMTYSPNMKQFYLVCALGWVLGLATLRGRARVLVVASLAAFTAWAVYSLVYLLLLNAKWLPPIPIYLEQCLFALYLAAAVAGYWGMVRTTAVLVARLAGWLAQRAGPRLRWPAPVGLSPQFFFARPPPWSAGARLAAIAIAFLAVAIFPARVVKYALTDARAKVQLFYDAWDNEPELMEFTTGHLGLAAGQPFRGTINFLTVNLVTINTIVAQWLRKVPTLNEYSQLVSPEMLYFANAFLKSDVRLQLNRIDMMWGEYSLRYWAALQMFGVRYTAATGELPDAYNPGLPLTTKPLRPHQRDEPTGTWYLYELPHPNVGNYSPIEVATAASGAEIIATMREADFDFTGQVVLSAPLGEPLVPARDMRMSTVRGGLHVSGRSDGTSLVLLPQQFSHCLRATDRRVRFVRANLMLAGMIFSGDLDADIVFDYGLFSPGCRWADLADLKKLDLKIDLKAPHFLGDRLFPDWVGAVARLGAAFAAIK